MRWVVFAAILGLLVAALVGAWFRIDFDLEEMSLLGSALSPLVGILSLGAIVVALYAVRLQGAALASQERGVAEQLQLQREALARQDLQIKQQTEAIADQLKLQREALLKQDIEIKQQADGLGEQLAIQREALAKQDRISSSKPTRCGSSAKNDDKLRCERRMYLRGGRAALSGSRIGLPGLVEAEYRSAQTSTV